MRMKSVLFMLSSSLCTSRTYSESAASFNQSKSNGSSYVDVHSSEYAKSLSSCHSNCENCSIVRKNKAVKDRTFTESSDASSFAECLNKKQTCAELRRFSREYSASLSYDETDSSQPDETSICDRETETVVCHNENAYVTNPMSMCENGCAVCRDCILSLKNEVVENEQNTCFQREKCFYCTPVESWRCDFAQDLEYFLNRCDQCGETTTCNILQNLAKHVVFKKVRKGDINDKLDVEYETTQEAQKTQDSNQAFELSNTLTKREKPYFLREYIHPVYPETIMQYSFQDSELDLKREHKPPIIATYYDDSNAKSAFKLAKTSEFTRTRCEGCYGRDDCVFCAKIHRLQHEYYRKTRRNSLKSQDNDTNNEISDIFYDVHQSKSCVQRGSKKTNEIMDLVQTHPIGHCTSQDSDSASNVTDQADSMEKNVSYLSDNSSFDLDTSHITVSEIDDCNLEDQVDGLSDFHHLLLNHEYPLDADSPLGNSMQPTKYNKTYFDNPHPITSKQKEICKVDLLDTPASKRSSYKSQIISQKIERIDEGPDDQIKKIKPSSSRRTKQQTHSKPPSFSKKAVFSREISEKSSKSPNKTDCEQSHSQIPKSVILIDREQTVGTYLNADKKGCSHSGNSTTCKPCQSEKKYLEIDKKHANTYNKSTEKDNTTNKINLSCSECEEVRKLRDFTYLDLHGFDENDLDVLKKTSNVPYRPESITRSLSSNSVPIKHHSTFFKNLLKRKRTNSSNAETIDTCHRGNCISVEENDSFKSEESSKKTNTKKSIIQLQKNAPVQGENVEGQRSAWQTSHKAPLPPNTNIDGYEKAVCCSPKKRKSDHQHKYYLKSFYEFQGGKITLLYTALGCPCKPTPFLACKTQEMSSVITTIDKSLDMTVIKLLTCDHNIASDLKPLSMDLLSQKSANQTHLGTFKIDQTQSIESSANTHFLNTPFVSVTKEVKVSEHDKTKIADNLKIILQNLEQNNLKYSISENLCDDHKFGTFRELFHSARPACSMNHDIITKMCPDLSSRTNQHPITIEDNRYMTMKAVRNNIFDSKYKNSCCDSGHTEEYEKIRSSQLDTYHKKPAAQVFTQKAYYKGGLCDINIPDQIYEELRPKSGGDGQSASSINKIEMRLLENLLDQVHDSPETCESCDHGNQISGLENSLKTTTDVLPDVSTNNGKSNKLDRPFSHDYENLPPTSRKDFRKHKDLHPQYDEPPPLPERKYRAFAKYPQSRLLCFINTCKQCISSYIFDSLVREIAFLQNSELISTAQKVLLHSHCKNSKEDICPKICEKSPGFALDSSLNLLPTFLPVSHIFSPILNIESFFRSLSINSPEVLRLLNVFFAQEYSSCLDSKTPSDAYKGIPDDLIDRGITGPRTLSRKNCSEFVNSSEMRTPFNRLRMSIRGKKGRSEMSTIPPKPQIVESRPSRYHDPIYQQSYRRPINSPDHGRISMINPQPTFQRSFSLNASPRCDQKAFFGKIFKQMLEERQNAELASSTRSSDSHFSQHGGGLFSSFRNRVEKSGKRQGYVKLATSAPV